jgi:hypothetical protein
MSQRKAKRRRVEREARRRVVGPLEQVLGPFAADEAAIGFVAQKIAVPPALRPHLIAAPKVLCHCDARAIAVYELIAVIDEGQTQVCVLPREAAAAACVELSHIARELARPMSGGRTRITLIEPDGSAHFVVVRREHLARGGQA